MSRTGAMDIQITIVKRVDDETEGGSPIDGEQILRTIFANLVYLRGNEVFVAGRVKDEAEVQFIVYQDDSLEITTDDRIRLTRMGVVEEFNILDIVPECRPRLGARIIAKKAVKRS